VQVVPDDLQLAAGGGRVEDPPGQEVAGIGPSHVVAHALDVHALSFVPSVRPNISKLLPIMQVFLISMKV
jgi:hypothetical protein